MNFKHTLKKEERISLQKEIDFLFAQGNSFIVFPLRIVYLERRPVTGVEVAVFVSVPKRKFKHAVDRNYIKRLIREAYRLNKRSLEWIKNKDTGLLIAFLFVGNERVSYKEVEVALIKAFNSLKEKLQ
ncbi:MAG: ribonuclease P protein component [Dysgonamonadaceae bacterium]|nr:ribonuclease P protein component [Dysgonamonadaceae bacterium]